MKKIIAHAQQIQDDLDLYGIGFELMEENGKTTRLDPTRIKVKTLNNKKVYTRKRVKEICDELFEMARTNQLTSNITYDEWISKRL